MNAKHSSDMYAHGKSMLYIYLDSFLYHLPYDLVTEDVDGLAILL